MPVVLRERETFVSALSRCQRFQILVQCTDGFAARRIHIQRALAQIILQPLGQARRIAREFVQHAQARARRVQRHAIFRASVRFGMPVNALLLDSSLLGIPLKGANPVAHQVITEVAEQLLAADPGNANLTQDVLSFIRQRLCSGDFGLQDASRHLGLRRRTLQRKLRHESTSHRLLVEQARRDLSCCLLLGSEATATEAAYALGFPDPAAFRRIRVARASTVE